MYKDFEGVQASVTDLNAINNSITNILLTKRGSLPGKPRFGSDLYKIVFSQMDFLTESIAINYIKEALSEFEDRIIVENVLITSIEEYNKYVIKITYSYKNISYNSQDASENVFVAINI